MRGRELVGALRRKFACGNNLQLSREIGWTATQVRNVESLAKPVTPYRLANLVYRTAEKSRARSPFRAIVEFQQIRKFTPRLKGRYYVINYHMERQLYELLKAHRGVYLFYNSEGRILYVGKAQQRSLWIELNECFRGMRQVKIFKTKKAAVGKMSKIKSQAVFFHDTASYFSCYAVDPVSQVGNLEALLIRCVPNDLFNVRIERFVE